MPPRSFITTAIPYVNGRPHVGHALELVQTDALARHRRLLGEEVRSQTGTDDNALKNVQSAEAEGVPTQVYVDTVAARFAQLREPLQLSFDDFIKTSSDPRHAPGVEKLWRRCAAAGDFYEKQYEGLYCVGCEQFYAAEDLDDGRCREHGTVAELVRERNWFFRLSKYQTALHEVIASGQLRVEPAHRRNEVLSFIDAGLEDFSISRSVERARGWGIRVPDDPTQVIYVWWDALGNYITALGYATEPENFAYWWTGSSDRVHVIGKGIIRFHAIYWPAMLLSAGEALPTTIFVHEYLTAYGSKISKSSGNAEDPADLAEAFGSDAVRWWLLRDVARVGDTDFTVHRLVARANEDLANTLGNLINRAVTMVHRFRGGVPPIRVGDASDSRPSALHQAGQQARREVDAAMEVFDFRRATSAIVAFAEAGNRYVEHERPWDLAKAERKEGASGDALDGVLAELLEACRLLAHMLAAFLPVAASKMADQCSGSPLPPAIPIFPRLEAALSGT